MSPKSKSAGKPKAGAKTPMALSVMHLCGMLMFAFLIVDIPWPDLPVSSPMSGRPINSILVVYALLIVGFIIGIGMAFQRKVEMKAHFAKAQAEAEADDEDSSPVEEASKAYRPRTQASNP